MKKLMEKKIKDTIIIIATNDNGELKISDLNSYITKHMPAFFIDSNVWFAIGKQYIHTSLKNGELFCNIGENLLESNDDFPFKLLSFKDIEFIYKNSIS